MTQRDRWPELSIRARDGRTIEVFRRKDRIAVPSRGSTRRAWGFRVKAPNGRTVSTNGQGIERHSAVRQAMALAGAGAKVRTR